MKHALLAAAVILGTLTTPALALDAEKDLHRLFHDRYEWEMTEFPERAMRRGDYTNADRLTDSSLEAIERRHQETVGHLERLHALERSALEEDDRLNYDLFELRLSNQVEDHRFKMYLSPIGGRSGPQQSIPQMATGFKFDTRAHYAAYLDRLEQVPETITNTIIRLEQGLAEGRTPPRITIRGVPDQFKAVLEDGGLDSLAEPFAELPSSIPPGVQAAMRLRLERDALPGVRDALEKLAQYLSENYMEGARQSIAATDLPDGRAFYEHQLRKMTTTGLSPEDVHKLGLEEVARIRAEMMEVIRRSDFMERFESAGDLPADELFAAFINDLRTNPRFYHESEEALLTGYRDICKRVDAQLPKFFGVLPRLPYGVKKIPDFMAPQQTTAYYMFGNMENAEPGWFYANTYALDQRPKYEMIALAMHEAVPGHHLQSSIAQELEDVPEFRKTTWFTAYGEGWALYSERLGIEMGLYEDPYDDFGRLLYEMWRACRLVVDPGMHALEWSRDDAIAFMKENTALSELNIVNEIDRYIAWPGQACAYKIGELEIRRLRTKAEAALGTAFDLREFHDVVLGAGSIPLDMLEARVYRWIRRNPAGASFD